MQTRSSVAVLAVIALVAIGQALVVEGTEMTLKLKVLGPQGMDSTKNLTVEHHITVEGLKEIIERESGIGASKLKLFLNGKELENEHELEHYEIKDGSELEMTVQTDSYFGVDPNDKEAVKRVQQELSHNKFKELFGDDVNIEDLEFSQEHKGEKKKFDLKRTLNETVEKLLRFLKSNV